MKIISPLEELRESIFLLKTQQGNELQHLNEQFKTTAEKLKPANLLKNTFKDLTALPDLRGNLLDTSIGLAAGFLSKKVVIGTTHNPIKKLLGAVLQLGVTSFVSKHPEGIKSAAHSLINAVSSKKDTPV